MCGPGRDSAAVGTRTAADLDFEDFQFDEPVTTRRGTPAGSGRRPWISWLLQIRAWALATLVIAGYTGLVRRI